jgi:hypothetical protein
MANYINFVTAGKTQGESSILFVSIVELGAMLH